MPLRKIASKVVETGANTAVPIASKLVSKVAETPAGPALERAVEAGGKVVSPVMSLLRGGSQTVRDGALDAVESAADAVEDLAERVEPGSLDGRGTSEAAAASSGAQQVAPAESFLTKDLPLPTYDRMMIPAILDALNGLTVGELRKIRAYELEHGNRLPIIDRIDELLASADLTP